MYKEIPFPPDFSGPENTGAPADTRRSADRLDFSGFFADREDSAPPLIAGISLASAGTMNPFTQAGRANRRRFFRDFEDAGKRVLFCRQVHSREVFFAGPGGDVPIRFRNGKPGDGLVTRSRRAVLTVSAADCMPIFLCHRQTGVIGLCHSGWKGTGIVLEALALMKRRFAVPPEEVKVLLGPAIGSCCYRVDRPRAEAFAASWGDGSVLEKDGEVFLDLRRANRKILEDAGVREILSFPACTVCGPQFGSYRREGPEAYTRMAAYIGWA